MRIRETAFEPDGSRPLLRLVRVLLVHPELAPRLALKTILEAAGYFVDIAATPFEALAKLDEGEYELVLTGMPFDGERLGDELLAYARVKDYRPATAFFSSGNSVCLWGDGREEVAIRTEDVPVVLGQVADLIAARARRRYKPARVAGRA